MIYNHRLLRPLGVLFHSVSLHFGHPKSAFLLAFCGRTGSGSPSPLAESIA